MKSLRKVLANIRKGDHLFSLIEKNDKIMVGVSGGKDSLVLLYTLKLYQNFPHTDFTFVPVLLDLGFPNADFSKLIEFCRSIGSELIIKDAKTVYEILKIQKELKHMDHLPCSICSRMKKAAINKVANELGCNKVAFAHHADDAIETLLMNQIYGGRVATFAPKMYLENAKITFIRPLILAREKDIESIAKELDFPILKSSCPNDKNTMRSKSKEYLSYIYSQHPEAYENFASMLYNVENFDLWNDKIYQSIEGKDLSLKEVITKEDTLHMLDIRYKVFIKEQNISFEDEFDGSDYLFTNYLLYLKGTPIGTIRYKIDEKEVHIGRIAILKEYRNNHYGKLAIKAIEDLLKQKLGNAKIIINGQKHLLDYYTSLGYKHVGEEFMDAGIPHITLIKKI